MAFDISNYETVDERRKKFWAEWPTGRIMTHLVAMDEEAVTFRAELFRGDEDPEPYATGHAREVVGSNNVNRTSALENAETSAVGRALAQGGFASEGKSGPSREEMTTAQNNERATTDKRALVEECKRRGIPSTKANMDMIAAELSGGGPADAARKPEAEPSPDQLPPATDEERLASEPCAACGSERATKVLASDGTVLCADRPGCEKRVRELEAPM